LMSTTILTNAMSALSALGLPACSAPVLPPGKPSSSSLHSPETQTAGNRVELTIEMTFSATNSAHRRQKQITNPKEKAGFSWAFTLPAGAQRAHTHTAQKDEALENKRR